jgi:hypothetical protein
MSAPPVPLSAALPGEYVVDGLDDSTPPALRGRLLELGLVAGAPLRVWRGGARVSFTLRRSHLVARAAEVEGVWVVAR